MANVVLVYFVLNCKKVANAMEHGATAGSNSHTQIDLATYTVYSLCIQLSVHQYI